MEKIIRYIVDRMTEASTWLSVTFLVTVLGFSFELAEPIVQSVAAVGAVLAVLLPDRGVGTDEES